MWLAISEHYQMTHELNRRRSSTILRTERERLARSAYEVGCDVVQAVVDVCGTEARWTYLHDIVYAVRAPEAVLDTGQALPRGD